MLAELNSYIVIGGAEFAVTITEVDGRNERVITAADCGCGEHTFAVERRGFQNEDTFIVCECGREYPVEYRKAVSA